ncbi:hypothetical protein [Nocardia sp. NBC_00511]|uniref:hypothetical protein n=1 Tax=Nocardia sp. NBC_00511 TaxID=2903591 RepID=UPI0030E2DC6A
MPAAPSVVDDTHNQPGPILTAAGIVAMALTLTMVGYGELTWSALCALAALLCLRFGIALMIDEHHRVKAAKARGAASSGWV